MHEKKNGPDVQLNDVQFICPFFNERFRDDGDIIILRGSEREDKAIMAGLKRIAYRKPLLAARHGDYG